MKMIKYTDLSTWLKLAVIGGLVSLFLNGFYFIVGFFEGFYGLA